MNKEDIYQDARNAFGTDLQMIILAEECSELSKATLKLVRFGIEPWDNSDLIGKLAEEIADVRLMIEQAEYMFAIKEEVKKIEKEKLERLEDRIRRHNDEVLLS